MGNNFNSPAETMAANAKGAEGKAALPIGKMILLGMLAGAFIALGAASSSTAAHTVANVGLCRLVSGCVFPVGLMLIVVCGGELFTGNCLMGMAALNKQIKWSGVIRNLVIVWIANFVGSLIIAFVTYMSGNFGLSGGGLGAYTIKVALAKVNLSFGQGFFSGIGCNMLVCGGVLLAGAAKDIPGKLLGCFFPICAFVTAGFEHVVANMYYIPAGLMAMADPKYVEKAGELYGITAEQLSRLNIGSMFANLGPVTLGNIVGGGIFMGVAYYFVHIRKKAD